ncbi:hypothetical protein [Streptomyces sp. NPDC090025]|uniref:hypothetical protein n=1 Tax=Streptomyces sp. NPDC090025 TaxID=3365922 RepID=UPI0038388F81
MSTARLRRIADATGLDLSHSPAPEGVPPLLDALRSVANWETRPSATVPVGQAGALAEVDRLWHLHARRCGLFAVDGAFLLGVSGPGAAQAGWAVVRWRDGARLAAGLARPEEGLDFVAMSVDGRVVCGVIEEDDDYWIVVQEQAQGQ